MHRATNASSIYRFGVFRVDLRKGELLKHGTRIRIQDKPFQVLAVLLEKAGDVVTREELQQRLWPADTFVEFDDGLNAAVKKLRVALNDSPENPRFIETIPRRGYCFIAPITEELNNHSSGGDLRPADAPLPSVPTASAPRDGARARFSARVLVIGLTVAIAATVSLWRSGTFQKLTSGHSHAASDPVILPIVSLPGEERMPALSPEGGRVAFVWQSPDRDKAGIYAAVVASQSLVRLTKNGADGWPAWSADGRYVAFERYSGRKLSIHVVPAFGGPERLVYTGEHSPWAGPEGLSFSPDGKWLAFSEWTPDTQQNFVKLISLDGSGIRGLTSPPTGFRDLAPAFSPSGDHIAFVRSTGPIFVDELFVVPVAGGAPSQITFEHKRLYSPPVWTKDGQELLFASNRAGMESLWRIPVTGGTPVPIPGAGPGADHPTISLETGALAYENTVQDENVWRVDLRNNATSTPRALLAQRTHNLMPQLSPDGTKIAFESGRSGYEEIWISGSDGSNPTQVTHLERYAGSPRWSPDGQSLAFDFRSAQHTTIYVVELAKGSPRPLMASPDADNVVPSWSRDGRWVYFASNRGSKDFRIWKVPAEGGTPVQVTRNSGFMAFESRDGRSVFYSRLTLPGIWKVPAEGGSETLVCKGPQPDDWANWAVAENGLYYVASTSGSAPEIKYMEFAGGKISAVARMERPAFFGMTLSSDERVLIYSQRDRDEHDIVTTKMLQ